MSHLDVLAAQVRANIDAEASAVLLMNGLAAKLLEFKNDPAEIASLAAELQASGKSLVDAVVANTE